MYDEEYGVAMREKIRLAYQFVTDSEFYFLL
jgi:hypothetical protein